MGESRAGALETRAGGETRTRQPGTWFILVNGELLIAEDLASVVETTTIKAEDLHDRDVQVSDGGYQARVIRNPKVVGADVLFNTDDSQSFQALPAGQDVTIVTRND